MKKRVLAYIVAVVATFSMQSCVTNYSVSQPAAHITQYKSDAKLISLENKNLAENKKELISNFLAEKTAKISSINNSLKNSEIAKALKHTKTIDDLLSEAVTYLGTPYRFGGMTRKGIDCSAFVLSVFGVAAGKSLPRVAAAQAQEGDRVEKENLQKGDLVFFSHGRGKISHVGIVEEVTPEGDIKFIHAATSKGVMISSLDDSYWGPKYQFARRIISEKSDS